MSAVSARMTASIVSLYPSSLSLSTHSFSPGLLLNQFQCKGLYWHRKHMFTLPKAISHLSQDQTNYICMTVVIRCFVSSSKNRQIASENNIALSQCISSSLHLYLSLLHPFLFQSGSDGYPSGARVSSPWQQDSEASPTPRLPPTTL